MSSVDDVTNNLEVQVGEIVQRVNLQAQSRARRAVQVLYNKAQEVLAGQRSGRRYKLPFKRVTYQASKPGEPPAVRTGNLRRNWQLDVIGRQQGRGVRITAQIKSKMDYSGLLETGTSKMAARPYRDKVVEAAMPEINKIYSEPLI